jgi:hypothetical protein
MKELITLCNGLLQLHGHPLPNRSPDPDCATLHA